MSPDVTVHRPSDGIAIAEIRGEHDLETRQEIHDLFASLVEQNECVVIDLSEAEFIDSSFLQCLAMGDRMARERGSIFRVQLGTAEIVRKALEISGLLAHLDCVTDREQALAPARSA